MRVFSSTFYRVSSQYVVVGSEVAIGDAVTGQGTIAVRGSSAARRWYLRAIQAAVFPAFAARVAPTACCQSPPIATLQDHSALCLASAIPFVVEETVRPEMHGARPETIRASTATQLAIQKGLVSGVSRILAAEDAAPTSKRRRVAARAGKVRAHGYGARPATEIRAGRRLDSVNAAGNRCCVVGDSGGPQVRIRSPRTPNPWAGKAGRVARRTAGAEVGSIGDSAAMKSVPFASV